MNAKFQCSVIIVLLTALVTGCTGSNCTVTGKVTFPDGSPLTEGEVIFESPTMMVRGAIKKDGTYAMKSGDLKGIPKGTYQVVFGGFQFDKIIPSEVEGKPPTITPLEIPIDRKYLSTAKSGLTCEVKGRTKFDITVEKPAATAKK